MDGLGIKCRFFSHQSEKLQSFSASSLNGVRERVTTHIDWLARHFNDQFML